MSDPILSLLYGGASGAASTAATAIPALRRAAMDGAEAKALGRLSKDAEIGRAMQAFRSAVTKTSDLARALRDPRVLNVVLPAMGMADAVGQPGPPGAALRAPARVVRPLPEVAVRLTAPRDTCLPPTGPAAPLGT